MGLSQIKSQLEHLFHVRNASLGQIVSEPSKVSERLPNRLDFFLRTRILAGCRAGRRDPA
jgi:hypothetical protein